VAGQRVQGQDVRSSRAVLSLQLKSVFPSLRLKHGARVRLKGFFSKKSLDPPSQPSAFNALALNPQATSRPAVLPTGHREHPSPGSFPHVLDQNRPAEWTRVPTLGWCSARWFRQSPGSCLMSPMRPIGLSAGTREPQEPLKQLCPRS